MSETYFGECGRCGGDIVTYSHYCGHHLFVKWNRQLLDVLK